MARKRPRRRTKRRMEVNHGDALQMQESPVVLEEAVVAAAALEFLQADDGSDPAAPWLDASDDLRAHDFGDGPSIHDHDHDDDAYDGSDDNPDSFDGLF